MKQLDRNRNYAEIWGDSEDGHKFEQDGLKFGPDGTEMQEKGKKEKVTENQKPAAIETTEAIPSKGDADEMKIKGSAEPATETIHLEGDADEMKIKGSAEPALTFGHGHKETHGAKK
jgi:hypothetical protein